MSLAQQKGRFCTNKHTYALPSTRARMNGRDIFTSIYAQHKLLLSIAVTQTRHDSLYKQLEKTPQKTKILPYNSFGHELKLSDISIFWGVA